MGTGEDKQRERGRSRMDTTGGVNGQGEEEMAEDVKRA